ncbi:MAG: 1-acyl-sn-glycerol-3-phosphate acyltransferase [Mariniblastus sp.]|nr:1-acyl-sn-glycerol-3-phosphate acyltransferase [Mariniblastus sp.]
MRPFDLDQDIYETAPRSVSWFASKFPTLAYYPRFFNVVRSAGSLAKRNQYHGEQWCASSWNVLRHLEDVGVRFRIGGMQNIAQLESPCLIAGNHMSTLETNILPGVIRPHRKVTFVIKQSLLKVPWFGHVLRSRKAIAVSQTDPRADLRTMLEDGESRLAEGMSIVVFPQGTRTPTFDPKQFNSIGIKLAKRADVPIIPMALKTDAWELGKYVSDIGRIDPSKNVYIEFGKPLTVEGRGNDTQQAIIDFVSDHLENWNSPGGGTT